MDKHCHNTAINISHIYVYSIYAGIKQSTKCDSNPNLHMNNDAGIILAN